MMNHSVYAKAALVLTAAGAAIFAMLALTRPHGPQLLEIDSNGLSIVSMAKRPWDKVCFYPQFSNPEGMNGLQSYSSCDIWTDVEERRILIVFSSGNSCESFGVSGDLFAPYFEEDRCFSSTEMAKTKLVSRLGIVRLEE